MGVLSNMSMGTLNVLECLAACCGNQSKAVESCITTCKVCLVRVLHVKLCALDKWSIVSQILDPGGEGGYLV